MRIVYELTSLMLILGLTALAACRAYPPDDTGTPVTVMPETTAVSETQIPEALVTTEPFLNPVVLISYRPAFFLQEGVGNVMVVNVSIENKGYETFNTSPELFYVNVNNATFKYYAGGTDLKAFDIPDGGKINGKLAFIVPSGTNSPRANYSLSYSGARVYNVQWIER